LPKLAIKEIDVPKSGITLSKQKLSQPFVLQPLQRLNFSFLYILSPEMSSDSIEPTFGEDFRCRQCHICMPTPQLPARPPEPEVKHREMPNSEVIIATEELNEPVAVRSQELLMPWQAAEPTNQTIDVDTFMRSVFLFTVTGSTQPIKMKRHRLLAHCCCSFCGVI
jgi:hypothetical protein